MYDDISIYLTYGEFKQKYENEYYLNYRRKFPNQNFLDYLIKSLNAYLIKKQEFDIFFKKLTYQDSVYDVAEKTSIEFGKIILFLDQEIMIQKSKNEENINFSKNQILPIKQNYIGYKPEIISLFSGNTTLIDLVYYFKENFSSSDRRFSINTKFNQIYFYLKEENDTDTLNERLYIDFIRSEVESSYSPKRITSRNQDHMNTLAQLHKIFLKKI